MKKNLIFILIAAAAFVFWQYRFSLEKYFGKKFPAIAQSPIVQEIKQDISSPPPLISNLMDNGGQLTNEGAISWTNTNRSENGGLAGLKENSKLDQAAKAKLDDMFKQQYFEHINPQNVGPGDLAKKAGYNFISEGENLALGNFKDDEDLVTAWMNSPGHRANILNSHYTEIGVAVGQGIYEGHKTWLAVQEFGRPASSCPVVDVALKAQINALEGDINQIQPQLANLKQQLDSASPSTQADYDSYNQIVSQYNSLVKIYNNKVDELKQITGTYNGEVNGYNTCLASP